MKHQLAKVPTPCWGKHRRALMGRQRSRSTMDGLYLTLMGKCDIKNNPKRVPPKNMHPKLPGISVPAEISFKRSHPENGRMALESWHPPPSLPSPDFRVWEIPFRSLSVASHRLGLDPSRLEFHIPKEPPLGFWQIVHPKLGCLFLGRQIQVEGVPMGEERAATFSLGQPGSWPWTTGSLAQFQPPGPFEG